MTTTITMTTRVKISDAQNAKFTRLLMTTSNNYDDTKGEDICNRSEIIRGLQDLPGNIKTVLAQDNKVSSQPPGHSE